MKSLVAEDDATNRKLLQTFLSRYGVCGIAVDGKEAVNEVRAARQNRQSYDLVCMDLRMPLMDGQEAIRENRFAAAVATSASLMPDSVASKLVICEFARLIA